MANTSAANRPTPMTTNHSGSERDVAGSADPRWRSGFPSDTATLPVISDSSADRAGPPVSKGESLTVAAGCVDGQRPDGRAIACTKFSDVDRRAEPTPPPDRAAGRAGDRIIPAAGHGRTSGQAGGAAPQQRAAPTVTLADRT